MAKKQPFTTKQQRFVDCYDGNATEAARIAGYANPMQQGERLLRNVEIATAIQRREKKRTKNTIATRIERQEFWTATVRNADEDMKNRLKASELLGKSEADFIEKKQVHGNINLTGDVKIQVFQEILNEISESAKGFSDLLNIGDDGAATGSTD